MKTYAICPGNLVPACLSCRRFIENNPDADANPDRFKPLLKPATDGTRCADFLGIPAAARDSTHGRL